MTDAAPEEGADLEALMVADEVDFATVMECVFDLHPPEIDAYLTLASLPGSTAQELAETLDRDRSTVARSLHTLLDMELVERERRIVDGGGHVYQYYAAPIEHTQQRMRMAVNAWVEEVYAHIDDIDTDRLT